MIYKLRPALKTSVWGGLKLASQWGKQGVGPSVSEAWELSFNPEGCSVVEGGPADGLPIYKAVPKQGWGSACAQFSAFPVLNKFIDAAQPLSVQVHPTDEYALSHGFMQGKTEIWYILAAEEGAYIYLGFKKDISAAQFADEVARGTVLNLLNKMPVKAGQVYVIPAGTVHSAGGGITLYEIQQNSTITYRVYDYGRVDKNGAPRELHLQEAMDVLSFKGLVPQALAGEGLLYNCKYFTAYAFSGGREIGSDSTFTAFTVIDGNLAAGNMQFGKGCTGFVPAGERVYLRGSGKYILTCVGDIYN